MKWLQLNTKSVFEGTYNTSSSSIIGRMSVATLSAWNAIPLPAQLNKRGWWFYWTRQRSCSCHFQMLSPGLHWHTNLWEDYFMIKFFVESSLMILIDFFNYLVFFSMQFLFIVLLRFVQKERGEVVYNYLQKHTLIPNWEYYRELFFLFSRWKLISI